jgi:hypothetical protein
VPFSLAGLSSFDSLERAVWGPNLKVPAWKSVPLHMVSQIPQDEVAVELGIVGTLKWQCHADPLIGLIKLVFSEIDSHLVRKAVPSD